MQDETRTFKRQLEDKRAIIENNLLTGRQRLQQADSSTGNFHLNTNDNSLSSDTSESDGKQFKDLLNNLNLQLKLIKEVTFILAIT